MLSILKNLLKRNLLKRKEIRIKFGKNKNTRLWTQEDLNLDMMLGFHEPNTFEVFDIFVKPGMVVADIGANIGYFTTFLSSKTGPTGQVHCFEPIPETFKRLTENISLNKLTNVFPVNQAVSSSNGSVTMFLSHTHYMASLDVNWAKNANGSTEVPATTLDTYFENLGKYPDFIKMDIEGGGVFALEGMKNCILKGDPVLLLESHTPAEDLAIGRVLSLRPFKIFRVGENTPVTNLNSDYSDKNGIYGTVVAIPETRWNSFKNWTPDQFQKKKFGQR